MLRQVLPFPRGGIRSVMRQAWCHLRVEKKCKQAKEGVGSMLVIKGLEKLGFWYYHSVEGC